MRRLRRPCYSGAVGRPDERQLGHLLRSHVVEDLDGAEVGAGALRQAATTINFNNVIIVGPRLHHDPRFLPSKWLISVLV